MEEHLGYFSLKKMAKIMRVSRSGYYSYAKHNMSHRKQESEKLGEEISFIYKEHRGLYGSPRIHAVLKHRSKNCSRKRVAKIMKARNLKAKMNNKFRKQKKYQNKAAPDQLNQNFHAGKPNLIWVSDICYIKTKEGKLYLAAIMDLFSRKVVSFSIDDHMKVDLVERALTQAIFRRRPQRGLIHHSDRGSQYTSHNFKKMCKNYFIDLSMNSRNCYDNAAMESFFHTLKTELVYLRDFETKREAKEALFEYIEGYYNRNRLHSTLGYISPESFEVQYKEKQCLCS